MTSPEPHLISRLKYAWDEANARGDITFRADTLREKQLAYSGLIFDVIQNSTRDVYDRAARLPAPPAGDCPFCGDLNPVLAQTSDGFFRVLGNRFACIRYQCILVAAEHQTNLDEQSITHAVGFALSHPELTLLHNSPHAGQAVPHTAWLLSVKHYDALDRHPEDLAVIGSRAGIMIQRRTRPAYRIEFDLPGDAAAGASILASLAARTNHRNFNIILSRRRAYFIPREPVEVPAGFDGHRFGGLEMIGYFVMKSESDFHNADARRLAGGIAEISLLPSHRAEFEAAMTGSPFG